MAPAHPGKMKSEGARQRTNLTEANIRRRRKRFLEQFARIHVYPFTLTMHCPRPGRAPDLPKPIAERKFHNKHGWLAHSVT